MNIISPIKNIDNHTMGNSLFRYLEIKVHHLIREKDFKEIIITGEYDRKVIISKSEKNDKLFNWQRPTAEVFNETLVLKCFPGKDYVKHYFAIIESYLYLNKRKKPILRIEIPTNTQIIEELNATNLGEFQFPENLVIGTVEQIHNLTDNNSWEGNGNFLLSRKNNFGLIGCKFSFWGDICCHLAELLIDKGVKNLIYVGKLGSLKEIHEPNINLASGNTSKVEEELIEWENMFRNQILNISNVQIGNHITLSSVLQETKDWLKANNEFDFVDPEIGQMAKGVLSRGGNFSYLHIISDNLATHYEEDLSNERKNIVLEKRKEMYKQVAEIIEEKFKTALNNA